MGAIGLAMYMILVCGTGLGMDLLIAGLKFMGERKNKLLWHVWDHAGFLGFHF